MSYEEFIGLIKNLDGDINGRTVKEMANTLNVARRKIYGWLWRAKKFDKVPIWSHRIPHKKEKLYYLSTTWRDFDDTHTDLGRRCHLALWHGLVQEKRAKELHIDVKIVPEIKKEEIIKTRSKVNE